MTSLSLGGLAFEPAALLTAERDERGRLVVETPSRQYANPHDRRLNAFGRGPFARFSLPTSELRPGVFAIVCGARLVYLARTTVSLADSFGPVGLGRIEPRACYELRDQVRCRVNGALTQALLAGTPVEVFFHPSGHGADLVRSLVAMLAPPWNDAPAQTNEPAARVPRARETNLVAFGSARRRQEQSLASLVRRPLAATVPQTRVG